MPPWSRASEHGSVECVDLTCFQTRAEARQAVFEFVECFYTRVRRHSSLHYISPVAFEQLHCELKCLESPRKWVKLTTANNGVEFPQDLLDLPSPYRFPFLLHLLSVFLDSFFARLGKPLPSRFGVRDSVESDVKAQEVETLRQVNNGSFLG